MSEPKFTPGEWEVYYIPKCSYEHIRIDAGEQRVATVNHVGRNDQERNANAYLMAASKEMYKALKEAFSLRCPYSWCRTNSGQVNHGYCSTHQRIYNALTKAEGGPK